MQIKTANNKKILSITKTDWEDIGKKAGWDKVAFHEGSPESQATETLIHWLGWQGGTVHDAVREAVKKIKAGNVMPLTVCEAFELCKTFCDPRALE